MTEQNIQTEGTEKQEILQEVYDYTAEQIAAGRDREDIVETLMAEGLDEKAANHVIDDINSQVVDDTKKRGQKNMVWGAIWCVGGIIVTAATYSAAEGGGTYVVAWGAILFGAIQFFQGLIQANK